MYVKEGMRLGSKGLKAFQYSFIRKVEVEVRE